MQPRMGGVGFRMETVAEKYIRASAKKAMLSQAWLS